MLLLLTLLIGFLARFRRSAHIVEASAFVVAERVASEFGDDIIDALRVLAQHFGAAQAGLHLGVGQDVGIRDGRGIPGAEKGVAVGDGFVPRFFPHRAPVLLQHFLNLTAQVLDDRLSKE